MKQWVWQVNIRVREDRGWGDLPGFLDMLRYDAAVVRTWGHEGDVFEVILRSDRAPTVERWSSFGITCHNVKEVNQ